MKESKKKGIYVKLRKISNERIIYCMKIISNSYNLFSKLQLITVPFTLRC